jgi:hypothetical protein
MKAALATLSLAFTIFSLKVFSTPVADDSKPSSELTSDVKMGPLGAETIPLSGMPKQDFKSSMHLTASKSPYVESSEMCLPFLNQP